MNELIVKRPDLDLAKDCLNAMNDLKLKYLLVKNFFTAEEVRSILNDLRNLPKSLVTEAAPGYDVFPRTAFNTKVPDEAPEIYFSAVPGAIADLKKYITVDVRQRFEEVFKTINAGNPVDVLPGPAQGSSFIPVNFRIMNPRIGGKGTSHIHNGSNITQRCKKTYSHIESLIDFENQLSMFCLLQNCEEGGDLTIYDYPRELYPELSGTHTLISKDRKEIDLERTAQKTMVHMEPGDLIVFPGGQLWHRVEIVKKGERISLGGFAAPRYSDRQWFYWI